MTRKAPRKPSRPRAGTTKTAGDDQHAVVTIRVDADIGDAIELMREHDIRHLPVLDAGRLVGVVSERDLAIIETLLPDTWQAVAVAEAMTPSPYAVRATTPITKVAADMADRKYGCAVVTDARGGLLGLFTTTDALRVLANAKRARTVGEVFSSRPKNSGVRARPADRRSGDRPSRLR